jgi:hypothetical protein
VLRTNTIYNAETVAHVYKALWTVEAIFRTAKSILETRPIYHKCNETIRGHVFCSFLALLLKTELGTRKSATALREPPLKRQRQSNVGGEGSPSVFSREESSLDKALSKPFSLNLAARQHLEFSQQASSPSRYLLL